MFGAINTQQGRDRAGRPVRVAPGPAEPVAFVQGKEGRAAFVGRMAARLSSRTQAFVPNSFLKTI